MPRHAIGQLSALKHLDLARCKSLGALPCAIGQLGALEHLELTNCTQHPLNYRTEIGGLKALEELDLGNCSSLTALPDAIGKLDARELLNLIHCPRMAELPDSFGGLTALGQLYLSVHGPRRATRRHLRAFSPWVLEMVGCTSLRCPARKSRHARNLGYLDLTQCSSLTSLGDSW